MIFTNRINARYDEIQPHLRQYRDTVPHASMAASGKTVAFFMATLELAKPARLIEHGSGFTSFAFSAWARLGLGEYIVWESNPSWIKFMRGYLREHTFDFQPRRLFREDFHQPFALFLDGPRDERPGVAQMVLPYAEHGIVLFDDANREIVRDIASEYAGGPGTLLDVQSLTTDEYGRYAYLWVGDHFIDTLAALWEETGVMEATWL